MREKKMIETTIWKKAVVWFCLCLFVISAAGCEPLRKKFIRQKKKDKENSGIQPILDPIDYPAATHSAMERYQAQYSLWKVWDREILQAIHEKRSDKKIRSLLDQLLAQLDGMRAQAAPEQQGEIDGLRAAYLHVQASLDKPVALRNMYSLEKQLLANSKKIRRDLNPKQLQKEGEPGGSD